jgi:Na+-transporting NADH:ubiquinone oxidoreductase subunit C
MTLDKKYSDGATYLFTITLCVMCALILSVVAYSLRVPQEKAREFDQSKQMLIAAHLLDHPGYFTTVSKDNKILRARFDVEQNELIEDPKAPKATDAEIRLFINKLIRPLLVDKEGSVFTLEEKNVNLNDYLIKYKKIGYAFAPLKLIYIILPMEALGKEIQGKEVIEKIKDSQAIILPMSGFGLWDVIYGYLAIKPNGNTVIGTTWYEMSETPGLGANITDASWQNQFLGKKIFQQTGKDEIDFKTANLGITVVKGKVRDVLGNSPKANSAVDGISGATLTGEGITAAYNNSLEPYRTFLLNLQGEKGEKKNGG